MRLDPRAYPCPKRDLGTRILLDWNMRASSWLEPVPGEESDRPHWLSGGDLAYGRRAELGVDA